MRYLALATDYDGTLATDGVVDESTNTALQRVISSGRKLILVTGRHLPDLRNIYRELDLFDRVVAENGALLFDPRTGAERLLCDPPSEKLVAALRRRGVPFLMGRSIIASWLPQQTAVADAIREAGVDDQIILNKDAVMILPRGVDKATGLVTAAAELGISACNVVGVGDAENDEAFLAACGCGVAVANALPALKASADIVLQQSNGDGVIALIEELLADDLEQFDARLSHAEE